MERGHPVRLSAQREQSCNCDGLGLSVLRTLADKDVRAPIACAALIFPEKKPKFFG
jgi:hypothetical protein